MGAINRIPEDSDVDSFLAISLADKMTARELRIWCSEHGVSRSYGDSKLETARKAVEQNPDAVAAFIAMHA